MRQRIPVDTLGFHKNVLKSEYELAASQSTLLIDELVTTISVPGLTVRADALNAVWRQFGLLLSEEIRQSLAYFGIREDPLAALTGESPTCHC
jgi:hypothetical protein